jgi:hypothetical protein
MHLLANAPSLDPRYASQPNMFALRNLGAGRTSKSTAHEEASLQIAATMTSYLGKARAKHATKIGEERALRLSSSSYLAPS